MPLELGHGKLEPEEEHREASAATLLGVLVDGRKERPVDLPHCRMEQWTVLTAKGHRPGAPPRTPVAALTKRLKPATSSSVTMMKQSTSMCPKMPCKPCCTSSGWARWVRAGSAGAASPPRAVATSAQRRAVVEDPGNWTTGSKSKRGELLPISNMNANICQFAFR